MSLILRPLLLPFRQSHLFEDFKYLRVSDVVVHPHKNSSKLRSAGVSAKAKLDAFDGVKNPPASKDWLELRD